MLNAGGRIIQVDPTPSGYGKQEIIGKRVNRRIRKLSIRRNSDKLKGRVVKEASNSLFILSNTYTTNDFHI